MGHMNKPRFNRCDACGRNPHKVVARFLRTNRVEGFCPSCWLSLTVNRSPRLPPFDWDAVRVLADNRSKKPEGTTAP